MVDGFREDVERSPASPREDAVRTRFAPSPTGRLHLGNVRVAVFNWLFARRHGGAFILRIEDTDPDRTREGSEAGILGDLRWLGLEWDEGPDRGGPRAPYRQSERQDLHRSAARDLVRRGRAYPCYCTSEELEGERREVSGDTEVHHYSGRCRDLSEEERRSFEEAGRAPSIRFRRPATGQVEIRDEVRGEITFPLEDFDDFVLLRSDGRATYNFAVVVDDLGMEITHVIRGAGHLSNTPKQALLYDALDAPRPAFAHLPTVLAPEGGRLSKREDAAAVEELRKEGYHPDGVVNYLSLLGWSSEDEKEFLTRTELIEEIGLDRLGASDTVYDPEKLRWLSGRHIMEMAPDELVDAVEPFVDRTRYSLDRERLASALKALRSRMSTFGEVNEHLRLLFPREDSELEATRRSLREDPDSRRLLSTLREDLSRVEPWQAGALSDRVRETGRKCGASGAALFHPIRKALTGRASGPDLGRTLEALGPEEALRRLDRTLEGT